MNPDRESASTGIDVIARQCALPAAVKASRRVKRQRVRRNDRAVVQNFQHLLRNVAEVQPHSEPSIPGNVIRTPGRPLRRASPGRQVWGCLASAPSFLRTVLVATAVGATAGGGVVLSLVDRSAGQASVAERTLVRPNAVSTPLNAPRS
jgi:anti-sigma-K factor RskA